jgi:phage terminase large subunit-like protein
MAMMTPDGYQGEGSPDRCDAAVWLFTELFPSIITRPDPVDHMALMRRHRGGWQSA